MNTERDQEKISVCIPAYEMRGYGRQFLAELLSSIDKQEYHNVEIVVSDHSSTSDIEDLCRGWQTHRSVVYVRCGERRGNSSVNMNNAIAHATGSIIKPMHQDDFFISDSALGFIGSAFGGGALWGACGYAHASGFDASKRSYRVPHYNQRILTRNTIGAPSVCFFRRELDFWYDENLIWMNDADLYFRLYGECGEPRIIPDALVCIRLWDGQVSNQEADEVVQKRELAYASAKHGGTMRLEPHSLRSAIATHLPRPLYRMAKVLLESPTTVRRVQHRLKFSDDPLSRLANAYGTDKGTRKTAKWEGDRHHYTPIYHRYLGSMRNTALTLLEIGIGSGPSLKMWYSYFPGARIYALDSANHTDKDNDRVTTMICDQSDRESLRRALNAIGEPLDVVIDDGGHYMHQQQISLGVLFPALRPGGLYFIEDLHTSYWPWNGYSSVYDDIPIDINLDRSNTTLKMVRDYLQDGAFSSTYLTDEELSILNTSIETCTLLDTGVNCYGPNHLAIFKKR